MSGTAKLSKNPILVAVAWPYANGPLHLGHVAGSLLPPDIFRRAVRMLGHPVLMVSGSDCHGTPIMIQAEKEGKTPAEVVATFHADHVRALTRLGIGFDLFTTTTTANHREWVQRIFLDCLAGGYIEKRTQKAPYDTVGKRFLPDRYVEGTCPNCKAKGARGDQCDACGKTLDPQELLDPVSKLNPGAPIEFRDTDHFFFLLSKLQPALESYVAQTAGHWRANTINFTQNWLKEGLQDRAITRDLTWGIPIPPIPGDKSDYSEKRIYVWFEAVCGYLSASVEWARRNAGDPHAAGEGQASNGPIGSDHAAAGRGPTGSQVTPADWHAFWTDRSARSYYFLGKDNIPFHTIIWPAILIAENQARMKRGEAPLNLPFDVPANEFLNLSGLKFSKSQGVGIGVHEVLDRFEADAVRYYLSINMPEGKDADWTWDDFTAKVNDELVSTLGNFVHRVVSFTQKNLGHIPPAPAAGDAFDRKVTDAIEACGHEMELHLRSVQLRPGIRRLMALAIQGNQWMQETAPWALWKTDRPTGEARLHSLLRLVKAITVYMAPYLPHAAEQSWKQLGEAGTVHEQGWAATTAPLTTKVALAEPKPLFVKLDPKAVEALNGPAQVAPGEPKAATSGATAHPKSGDGKGQGKGAANGVGPGDSKASATPQGPAGKPGAPKGEPGQTAPAPGPITIEEFQRVQLRLATVKSVEAHPKADKLYVLKLDAGELGERQVVAGLKAYYKPEELVGQTVAFVANLQPAMLRGVESQGMILAADDGTMVAVLNPQRALPAGSKIR